MPVKTTKTKGHGYTNRTPGGVKGRNMTKKNAEAQKRLLNAIEHNPNFKPRHSKLHKKIMEKI